MASETSTRIADDEETLGHFNEPTILEYARFHGLCREYTLVHPSTSGIAVPSQDELDSDLQDPIGCTLAESDFIIKEPLTVSKDSAIYLRSIVITPEMSSGDELDSGNERNRAYLKQELPILRSDNELDLQNFGSTALPDFHTLKLPLETVNEAKGEGLEWPTKFRTLPCEKHQEAETEKLEISRNILLFLQTALKDTLTVEDYESVKADGSRYRRNPALQPLTPPLLPITPPLTPFTPSFPVGRLELLSELTDSTAAEAQALEDCFVKKDAIVSLGGDVASDGSDPMLLEHIDISQIFSPLHGTFELPLSPLRKRKASDLKVEGPLTPPMIVESPAKRVKSVSFPEILHGYIPELPSTFEAGDDISGSQNSVDAFFEEAVAPIVDQVDRLLENEKLQEVDTTRRVDVPPIEFSLPQAPWTEYGLVAHGQHPDGDMELDAQMMLLLRVKREELKKCSTWHGVAKLERELHWSPFPAQLGTVAVDERIQDNQFLPTLLEDFSVMTIADSSSLTSKPKGLRILDDVDESEDELDAAEIVEDNDMRLLKKKKLEIEEIDECSHPQEVIVRGREPLHQCTESFRSTGNHHQVESKQMGPTGVLTVCHEPGSGLMFGGLFSASTALDRFMELHGKRVKKPKVIVHPSECPPVSLHPKGSAVSNAKRQAEAIVPPEIVQTVPPKALRLPHIPEHLSPCSFIVSSTLLMQRRLARSIQRAYPDAEMIERDFSLSHSPSQEADILLSPSTGLILTTLQKIKQRALPGQPERSPIKERIYSLSERYERLILFVSEGLGPESERDGHQHSLDERDSEALAELESFANSMDAEVIVSYFPGGEQAFARWIVCAMERWGVQSESSAESGEVKLLQEETLDELFLRRAGLNAFAAQAILSSLKSSTSTSDYPESSSAPHPDQAFGLASFIFMSSGERIDRFQVLLGGNRILNRVSALIEQRWPSDGNNFAG
ncbi:hypothetical protein K432DRAFT_295295 [Lepidopterella palustris CBS 459.81]|uniref:Uncharacterized protein n=1 Tax=Lepidopterella palustris CBS 459.81 TaxID=1314670 RepID=A0A8E2ECL1_9PEZI|nr:hypothetical protein K432DRAFT_295295 [Lepidopterella palustris CBS 459.81]